MTTKADALIRKLEIGLTPLGAFRSRPMFGGYGLYLDDIFFGLIDRGNLYLRTDEENRGEFLKAISKPFTYMTERKGLTTTSYWQCPAEALEDARALRKWVASGYGAARRRKAARKPRAPRKRKSL